MVCVCVCVYLCGLGWDVVCECVCVVSDVVCVLFDECVCLLLDVVYVLCVCVYVCGGVIFKHLYSYSFIISSYHNIIIS